MHHKSPWKQTHIIWIIVEHRSPWKQTDIIWIITSPWKQTHHMDHHIAMETDTSYGSSHRHGIRDIIWIIVQHRLSCIVHHMNITDHHGNRHTDIMDHHGTLIIMGTGIYDHQEQITIKTDTMDDHGNNRYITTWSTADHHHQGLIELQRVGGQTLLSPCNSIST